ncbi:MAG: hypothetical protein FWE33_04675 [Defluviitaleaceae bacterium]|nr:hypothetical protein [Defluviitaleaceae bacterium]
MKEFKAKEGIAVEDMALVALANLVISVNDVSLLKDVEVNYLLDEDGIEMKPKGDFLYKEPNNFGKLVNIIWQFTDHGCLRSGILADALKRNVSMFKGENYA